jgi:hypothetical protein
MALAVNRNDWLVTDVVGGGLRDFTRAAGKSYTASGTAVKPLDRPRHAHRLTRLGFAPF